MINETEAEDLRTLIRAIATHLRRLGCVREAHTQDGAHFVAWMQAPNESDGMYNFYFPENDQTSTLNGETLMQAFYRKRASLRDVDTLHAKDLPHLSNLIARFAHAVLLSEASARQQVTTAKGLLQARLDDLVSRHAETLELMPRNCKQCGSTLDTRGLCEDECVNARCPNWIKV